MRSVVLSLVLVLVAGVVGCGGGGSTPNDAALLSDAFTPTEDAATPTEDAATPTEDAATPTEDAATVADDTGVTPTAACTNASDTAVTTGSTFETDLGACAMRGIGAEPGLMTCIEGLGLSSACAACFDAQVHCTIMHCALACASGNTPQCATCRANNCDAAFNTCAGF